ncbi:MAG: flagellar brake protein, partial [candidate division Zixibacteria bacterium]|nr:flagellar brake protein [candidate division Zixibacteria bacterium]
MATDVHISLPQTEQPLAVWEKVEILVGDDDQTGHYVSRIEDITNEGIIVSTPEFIDGVSRLREGCEIRGVITRDEAVYQFNARVKTFTVQGNKLYLLSGPSHFRRVQRRQFVRLELVRDLTCAIIKSGKNAHYGGDELTWSDVRMINISGGGIMMKSKTEV